MRYAHLRRPWPTVPTRNTSCGSSWQVLPPARARLSSGSIQLCEAERKGNFEIEVIDVYQQPKLARDNQIIATPTPHQETPAAGAPVQWLEISSTPPACSTPGVLTKTARRSTSRDRGPGTTRTPSCAQRANSLMFMHCLAEAGGSTPGHTFRGGGYLCGRWRTGSAGVHVAGRRAPLSFAHRVDE